MYTSVYQSVVKKYGVRKYNKEVHKGLGLGLLSITLWVLWDHYESTMEILWALWTLHINTINTMSWLWKHYEYYEYYDHYGKNQDLLMHPGPDSWWTCSTSYLDIGPGTRSQRCVRSYLLDPPWFAPLLPFQDMLLSICACYQLTWHRKHSANTFFHAAVMHTYFMHFIPVRITRAWITTDMIAAFTHDVGKYFIKSPIDLLFTIYPDADDTDGWAHSVAVINQLSFFRHGAGCGISVMAVWKRGCKRKAQHASVKHPPMYSSI